MWCACAKTCSGYGRACVCDDGQIPLIVMLRMPGRSVMSFVLTPDRHTHNRR